jgi:alkylhydroperoxidase family enzyme
MYLVNTVERDKAEGIVADTYALVPAQIDIPVPMRLLSATPGLMERQANMIRYFRHHDRLTPPLLAAIRYVASEKFAYAPCAVFNHDLLRAQGMSEGDIANLSCKPVETPLDESEAAVLAFVTKAVNEPGAVTRADIDALVELGWRESDVVDAVQSAANMLGMSLMYRTFVRD